MKDVHQFEPEAEKQPNYGTHAEWKGTPVLWVARDGVMHVARRAATMLTPHGPDLISQLACGGASLFWPVGTTWYDLKRQGHRFCRKCVAWVEAATPEK